ncbi:hypothetical protein LOTGIDRAFT_233404 [Lottia gigantea]|uniref:Small acidic protein-like domain-containing protein n=1 Tax=Lottia gigantea TaxID=225164 RepID=V4A4I6_LOTGI|nr:hypothetical protein LOTGIDRAFT_233404 [Lottia gigantea]ESO91622.1 hypothetical protein LOTGIDRAFT_233404 [Lottia gigantea]
MDLLAGYTDENSKQSPSLNQNYQSSSSKMTTERSLEDEWASFEKLIDGDAILESKDDAVGTSGEQKVKRKFSEGASETYSFEVQSGSSSDASSKSFSPEIILHTEVETISKEKESEQAPAAFRPKKDSGKGSSTSRSRSRSVSPRRHRKSKDKRSRSRSKDRSRDKKSHSRKEKRRHRSPHSKRSRSRSRKRSSSRHRSRSRDRKRGSKERRSSRDKHRHRSRSHDRSHKRKHRSKSRSPRRHRSKSRSPRRHRSKSRSPRRRHRRSRSPRRRRSYSRSRSPSPRYKSVPISSYQKKISGTLAKKPMTFREKMRQDLIKAGKLLDGVGEVDPNGDSHVTPQMALLQTMAAMQQKAQEMTGVAVPKYYNPAAVNPLKYAEQVQKRKLLWSKKEKKEEIPDQWQGTAFKADQDGKMGAKFRKLMGMGEDASIADEDLTEEQRLKREELFARLDKDYEFARMSTHTHRGVGLGFASQGMSMPQFPQP